MSTTSTRPAAPEGHRARTGATTRWTAASAVIKTGPRLTSAELGAAASPAAVSDTVGREYAKPGSWQLLPVAPALCRLLPAVRQGSPSPTRILVGRC
jgi:hypothetical protein